MSIRKIPPTPDICPNCKRPANQGWWCSSCGEFYSEDHSSAYLTLSTTEMKNIREILHLVSLLSIEFSDSWPDELTDTLLRGVTLHSETDGVTIKGFSILDLLMAMRAALTEG